MCPQMDDKIKILIVSHITMAELTVGGIKMIYVHIVIIIFVPKKLSGKIFISVKNALSINKKSQGHILKRQLPEHAIVFIIRFYQIEFFLLTLLTHTKENPYKFAMKTP